MALVKCHECGKQVSTEAVACPSCGASVRPLKVAPPKKAVSGWKVALVAAAAIGFVIFIKTDPPQATELTPAPPPPTREEIAKKADDANRDAQLQVAAATAIALKKAAKDPDTFELKSATVYRDGAACYEYRARNSFNAMLAGAAVRDAKGRVLIQEHDGNRFVTAWNSLCTRRLPADDVAPLLHQLGMA